MQRLLIYTLACFLAISLTAETQAANPLTSIWPFGNSKNSSKSSGSIKPISHSSKSKSTSGSFLDKLSPAKAIDGAQKKTDALFQKTRAGMKKMTTALNPFSKKSKKGGSLFDSIMPKSPPEYSSPSTVDEFLRMKRPGY